MNYPKRKNDTVSIERICDVCGNTFFDTVPLWNAQAASQHGLCEDCAEAEEQSVNDYTEEPNEQT